MIKTYKVMLCPNNKQNSKLFKLAGFSRFSFNWALVYEQENHKQGNKFLSDNDLRKIFTKLKTTEEYQWCNNYSNNVSKQAIKDAVIAYKKFFAGKSKFPKFKSKKKSKPSFYVDTYCIQFTENRVKLEKLTNSRKSNKQQFNWVKLAESNRIPINSKYVNPRVTFDGLHWWLSVGVEEEKSSELPLNDGVGIDIGVKILAVCSDGNTYKNINKSSKVKKLKKKQRRLQRKISKKYQKNKKGGRYCKTNNIIKSEKALLKLNHRLTNIRNNYLHQVTTEIVNRKPRFIVLEDLNVKGMMKNKHLARAIQEQGFDKFYQYLSYKSDWHSIKFITADRFYPSSKKCCQCGYINKDLKLSDRIYICPVCGNVIDRDYQASLNLLNWGKSIA